MAVTVDDDHEMVQLWNVVTELSEQLTRNRTVAASLRAHIVELNNCALHARTGFALRRFNLDMSQAAFEHELEQMNDSMLKDNRTLQHENKQLNALLREYEQTLELVMTAFRTHAHDVQEHELAMIRQYEDVLLRRESEELAQELDASTAISASLARVSHLLRSLIRSLGGEDPDVAFARSTSDDVEYFRHGRAEDAAAVHADWALERECELARLESENDALRRMLDAEDEVVRQQAKVGDSWDQLKLPTRPPPGRGVRHLGGKPGTVGPFGKFKRSVVPNQQELMSTTDLIGSTPEPVATGAS